MVWQGGAGYDAHMLSGIPYCVIVDGHLKIQSKLAQRSVSHLAGWGPACHDFNCHASEYDLVRGPLSLVKLVEFEIWLLCLPKGTLCKPASIVVSLDRL